MNSAIGRVASLMNGFDAPWGIAGGWAIDLFLGRESRPHSDIDVAVLRDDQRQLRSHLSDGHAEKVIAHRLSEWAAHEWLAPPVHEVHITWPDGFHLEFLLNEQDRAAGEWVFRRDERIRRSMAAAFVKGAHVPYLAPELVLLYKSKAPSSKDHADLEAVLPHLEAERRSWLGEALAITAPGHQWTAILSHQTWINSITSRS
jgi:hypothetical protein